MTACQVFHALRKTHRAGFVFDSCGKAAQCVKVHIKLRLAFNLAGFHHYHHVPAHLQVAQFCFGAARKCRQAHDCAEQGGYNFFHTSYLLCKNHSIYSVYWYVYVRAGTCMYRLILYVPVCLYVLSSILRTRGECNKKGMCLSTSSKIFCGKATEKPEGKPLRPVTLFMQFCSIYACRFAD